MPAPALAVDLPSAPVTAIAVLLHGGQSSSRRRVRPTQLAVLRMHPFASALRRAGATNGLAVARVRYALRGWNGTAQAPVADARWALDELSRRHPRARVAIVGHSMGGRTALYVADHPSVHAVVALAPWIEQGDPVAQLAGRRILLAHGALDRITSPAASATYARDAAGVAASVTYVRVRAERHAMLRRARVWHELTAGFVAGVLLDLAPQGTAGNGTANVLAKALAGQGSLVV
jgi:pimeloyl-ACP methyl ester carboxylesterase